MEPLEIVTRRVCVANDLGLHARPAAVLAREARKFSSRIILSHHDQEVDAKSILDILTLALGPGCTVELRAHGEDAQDALEHLEQLFVNRFQEVR